MTSPYHGRFIGGTISCSVVKRRLNLGRDHRYGDAYECPACGHKEPARKINRPWETRAAK